MTVRIEWIGDRWELMAVYPWRVFAVALPDLSAAAVSAGLVDIRRRYAVHGAWRRHDGS